MRPNPRLGPAWGTRYIFPARAKPSHRSGPVSSNVRPPRNLPRYTTEMISRRLELALERLQPSDWGRFERIASAFLATEFDELRTVANPGGDEGRDAELFSPLSEPTVVIQYSVAVDWRAKINKTVRRLKETIPSALVLVYATNQIVGSQWDDLKKTLRTKHGLSLDIECSAAPRGNTQLKNYPQLS